MRVLGSCEFSFRGNLGFRTVGALFCILRKDSQTSSKCSKCCVGVEATPRWYTNTSILQESRY